MTNVTTTTLFGSHILKGASLTPILHGLLKVLPIGMLKTAVIVVGVVLVVSVVLFVWLFVRRLHRFPSSI